MASKRTKAFRKYLIKTHLDNNKYNLIILDQSFIRPNKMGLAEIWPEVFHEVDRYFKFDPIVLKLDEKSLSFYKRFADMGMTKVVNKIGSEPEMSKASVIDAITQERQNVKDTTEQIGEHEHIVTFFDHDKELRCPRFMNGVACSSNCNYLHLSPGDDGVYCKYYYLHRSCPSPNCTYYHGKTCSLKTKRAYKDKYASKRCPEIMNYRSCRDSTCRKRHKLPKKDKVYCFAQLSLECRFGSECLYKHRDDLNSYPQSVMTTCDDNSVQGSISSNKLKKIGNLEFHSDTKHKSETERETSEEETSDEDNRSSLSDLSHDSDTDSIGSGNRYYFEDSSPKAPSYNGVGSILKMFGTSNRLAKNFSSIEESVNGTDSYLEEEANASLARPPIPLCPYVESDSDIADSNESSTSDVSSNTNDSHNHDLNKRTSSEMSDLDVVKEKIDISNLDTNDIIVKKEDLSDIDINEFIVDEIFEFTSDYFDATSTNNESSLNKCNEFADAMGVKIKRETPKCIALSSDDVESKKFSYSNQNHPSNIKKEVKCDEINTNIKSQIFINESQKKENGNINENTLVNCEDNIDTTIKTEIFTNVSQNKENDSLSNSVELLNGLQMEEENSSVSLSFNVKKEKSDSWKGNESLNSESSQKYKKIKLE